MAALYDRPHRQGVGAVNREEMVEVVTETLDTMTRDARYADKFAGPVVDDLRKAMMAEREKLVDVDSVTISRWHPDTSFLAAEGALPKSARERREVYNYIIACDDMGATDDEIHDALGMHLNTVRPRRYELANLELIVRNGMTRLNARGNECDVWVKWS